MWYWENTPLNNARRSGSYSLAMNFLIMKQTTGLPILSSHTFTNSFERGGLVIRVWYLFVEVFLEFR